MAEQPSEGRLVVISAPSGTGKSTVAHGLIERVPDLEFSISFTTRPRREYERDGRDYHFVDRERFEAMIRQGALLEWARVYEHLYGTGLEPTREALRRGRWLLLDIDVQGARQVRDGAVDAVSIMLLPPDYTTLEARLRHRGSEPEEELALRLARAREEAGDYRYFDYVVVNSDVETTVSRLEAIVRAEHSRVDRSGHVVQRILDTFPVEGQAAEER